jgi:zinc transporter, ZIP family
MRPITSHRGLTTAALLIFPVILLAGVIALFVVTNGAGIQAEPAAPVERLVFERTVLRPGSIELQVRNTGPRELTIAQISVADGMVHFSAAPDRRLPRLGRASLIIPYPWVEAEAYAIRLFSANSIPFDISIEAATSTKLASGATLLSFTLIGLYVGVIPIFLGIFWYPALRRLGERAFVWLMAMTTGLLLFLGIDATKEALEIAAGLGGPFQGVGLVGIGMVGAYLLLDALSKRQAGLGRDEAGQRLTIALTISIGIGLHNLGEGLAIGAAFSLGAATLGSFFVIGFILQNITEGLGIIAPIVKQKPSPAFLAGLGLIGGAPAIVGAWIGGLSYSRELAVLFLAVGAGAVFQVAHEISRLIERHAASKPLPLTVWSGVLGGMAVLYATGMIIK